MKLLVIGNPVKHSKSPLIHNYWLKGRNLDFIYDKKLVVEADLKNVISDIKFNKIKGINITLPYKRLITKYCDEIEDNALNTGAINTLYKKGDKLIGANTDGLGFCKALKEETQIAFKNAKIFVIGAGGAARGILFEIIKQPVMEITIINRTIDKSIQLKKELNRLNKNILIKTQIWTNKTVPSDYNLVINSSSYGMRLNEDLDINFSKIKENSIICDIIYNPQETSFLKRAKKEKFKIINGLGMLVHQASESFQRWFNINLTNKEILNAKSLIMNKK